jgi:ribosomal protein L40E
MIYNFLMSFIITILLLAEVILPIILILILGFLVWRLIREKWINRIFEILVYERHPFVKEFHEVIGRLAEEKGSKVVRPLGYIALILSTALIFKILWPYVFAHSSKAELFFKDGLPQLFLYIGLIFLGFGVLASIISSLVFIGETKKYEVYNRSIEIYLLSKYLEHILYITLGIALIIGTVYLWFFLLEKLGPVFSYFENESASLVDLKVNYEGMLKTLRNLLISFRDQFQYWCITSFLISLASFTVPYMWFKGRRFTRIFLTLFLSGTTFSYLVSFLIKKFIITELTWIFVSVWTFSALITYMVFHLINIISLNRIIVCRHCRTENIIDSKHCRECGKKLILVEKK